VSADALFEAVIDRAQVEDLLPRCIATSAWQAEEAMHATEDRVVAVDGVESVVGTPEVEQWKIAVLHCDHTSAPGAWVRTTWVHVEPEQTDRLADLYRMVLLRQIQTRAEADGAAADRRAGEDRATLERVGPSCSSYAPTTTTNSPNSAAKPPRNGPRCAERPASSSPPCWPRFDT
jgi:hypothetical protein